MLPLRDETGQWLPAMALGVVAAFIVFLSVVLTMEQALLERQKAEWILESALRAASRVLDPIDWSAGPLRSSEAVFLGQVAEVGGSAARFRVFQAGETDPETGYRFPVAGVGGCLTYSLPLSAIPATVCADEVTHVSP